LLLNHNFMLEKKLSENGIHLRHFHDQSLFMINPCDLLQFRNQEN